MGKQTSVKLGAAIPANIRFLSNLIARKPADYTLAWASSVTQAFSLYTNTKTLNLLSSINQILIEQDWPFPSFLNLEDEIEAGLHFRVKRSWWKPWTYKPNLFIAAVVCMGERGGERSRLCDRVMASVFDHNKSEIFQTFNTSKVLSSKTAIILDVEQAYSENFGPSA